MRARIRMVLSFLLVSLAGGCASGPMTHFELQGPSGPPAVFEFRDVFWRTSPDASGGIEVVGYGFVGFYNNPMARDYDPRWATTSRVTIRIHGISRPQGEFELTLLGPSMTLGPGDDEMITAAVKNIQIQEDSDDRRTIQIPATPAKSRNRAGEALNLSGTILATRTSDRTFEAQVKQFSTERGYRDLPHALPPGGR